MMRKNRLSWPPRRVRDQAGLPEPRQARARNPLIGLFGRTNDAEPPSGLAGAALARLDRAAIA